MNRQLKREVGVFGATMMGMGSIVGTGVFVSIGIAAEVAGPSVVVAIALASLPSTRIFKESNMKSKTPAIVLGAFLIGAIAGVVLCQIGTQHPSTASAQPVAATKVPATRWLSGTTEEQIVQIERQLRGFDVTMAEVGYRYDELVAAAKSRNWDYAQYQTEKIAHTIRLGLERRPEGANPRCRS